MELIDREDHQKLYFQLYEILKRKIESQEWPVGSQIPTEEELCKLFNVSRVTVRTAVMELVRQGYLKRQQGKGTFIFRSIISEGLTMYMNFRDLMLDEGITFSPSVLARTVMMPVDKLDKKLNIPQDKHIIFIKRLWSAENKPVLLQEAYIPYHLCPLLIEEELEGHSLIELLEKKYTIKITHIKNFIEVTSLKTDEAQLLGLTDGSAAILLNQYFYSGDTLVLYARLIKRTDRFTFFMELERKAP